MGAVIAALILGCAGSAEAAEPAMLPADPASFCARMHLQPDGQTLLASSPVTFHGKRIAHAVRAGMNSDHGSDVFGEILNLCGDRIARPALPHQR